MAFLSNPKISILQATQCSYTICSVPALRKMARYLCIEEIPGSNRLHTQSKMQYHNKVSFYYMWIQYYKVFDYNLHSSRLAQRITAEN